MTAEEMWNQFTAESGVQGSDYEAWSFGTDADTLAALTAAGVKTATSSAYPLYALEGEPLPEEGAYSVILNAQEEAVCVIRTERVSLVPFDQVPQEHAYREGEGDRTLAYWREVHEPFFWGYLEAAGLPFTPETIVVCEEFRVVYGSRPQGEQGRNYYAEAEGVLL